MKFITVRDRSSYLRMIGVLFLTFASAGLTAPLYANFVRSLGANTSQLGLVLATFQIASLSSQYLWGRSSDKLGRRKPLVLFGTAGIAIAALLSSMVGQFQWLFGIRVLEGLASAAYNTGSLALVGDLIEDQEQRGKLMGAYRMAGSLAFSIAALSGGLLADRYGLRTPIVVSSICMGLGFLLASGVREARRTPVPASPEPIAPQPVSDQAATTRPEERPANLRILVPFLGLSFVWFLGMGSVVAFWPVYMSRSLNFPQWQISGLWALAAFGEVFWLFVAGLLADRIGRKWLIIIGVTGMAGIYLSYTVAQVLVAFVMIQMVRSFTYSSYETPALLYATELGLRQQRGRLAGLYYTASGIGGVAGSLYGGFVAEQFGMPTMFRITAALMLTIALVAALVMPGRTTE